MPAAEPVPADAAPPTGGFLLAACRAGAEAALVARQQAVLPLARPGAWRRGVVTFRLPNLEPDDAVVSGLAERLVFARCCVRSFGQVTGAGDEQRIAAAVSLAGAGPWHAVHVWKRDPRIAADVARLAADISAALGGAGPTAEPLAVTTPDGTAAGRVLEGGAAAGLVLDCVLDSTERWWIGRHHATVPPATWPGGIAPTRLPPTAVSRAWLKLDEAVTVFALPLVAGQRAIELGAAPGGACQRLLEAGLDVIAVDPALVAPQVAAHPRFRQWRMRARDVKRRAFRGCDWLVSDMNIDPASTMAALERILTTPGVRPAGVVATLKLPQWSRAEALPEWLASFTAWGYAARVRQLSTGGRELCVAAVREN
jgi:23S rRNA (cytidine2498-2'-O)-methyltransferase